ncbi:hypothetical protein [Xanthocytophaga agilis]|uniref:Uncharacterized protein n=1 Tax=Xanthocytophaga agilis TaxID=3048010 RepID=A0AAE3R3B5_9BACT|nr:hypothetical protein [Xanthocytophaga agilis]MDJ1500832.1 hypothetical protein [Xanthocytophaga agilis]
MKKTVMFFAMLFVGSISVFAQDKGDEPDNSVFQFLPVYDRYASKECIVKLKDGTTVKGINDDLDRKKGQITAIEIKDPATKKTTEYKAEQIDEMYLYPSGFDKLSKRSAAVTDLKAYTNNSLDKIMSQGYCYFKNQSVSLKNKKKEKEFLMQLVNPDFCSAIMVFGDNMAKESASIGVGPMKVAGGIDKSFYVRKGDEVFWLKKAEFEDNYDRLFGDSPEFVAKFPKKDVVWRKLNLYIYEYTKTVTK